MKKILIFLTIFLSGAWAYTSWYWYTCHLQDVCTIEVEDTTQVVGEILESNGDTNSNNGDIFEEDIESLDSLMEEEDDSITGNDIESLSAGDVTGPSSIAPPRVYVEVEEGGEEQISENGFLPTEEPSTTEESDINNEQERQAGVRNICQNPLRGPISLGGNNARDEVLALEIFLINRGLLTQSDGVFGNDDFEAVKAFQEEFRSEILTPWGINNPTGYVGRTTIEKIQQLACN
ncbi:peptidoglycan-binding protein [Candidatus Gracilibacteria bacterium]|nr:peptidoglycan-binding protein [Candidatus Gracilibacteria bacterium]